MHSIITRLYNTSEFVKPLHILRFTQSSQNPFWSLLWISPFYTRGCRKLNKVNDLLRVTPLMTGTGPPARNIVLSPLHPSCLRCGPKVLRGALADWWEPERFSEPSQGAGGLENPRDFMNEREANFSFQVVLLKYPFQSHVQNNP